MGVFFADRRCPLSAVATIPTYVPLDEAARQYGLSEVALRRAVEQGIIRAVRLLGEGIAVADEDVAVVAERDALWKKVKHLDGHQVGIEEACRKYNVSKASVYRWIELGYVRVLDDQRGGGRGHKRLVNEADVAYAALVADARGRKKGKRILVPEFIPPHASSQL